MLQNMCKSGTLLSAFAPFVQGLYHCSHSANQLYYGDELTIRTKRNAQKPARKSEYSTPVHSSLKLATPYATIYPELHPDDPELSAIEMSRSQLNPVDDHHVMDRCVVLEGTRLISDALNSGGHIRALYFTSRQLLENIDLSKHVQNVYFVPHRILKKYSKLKTFPGIIAIFHIPDPSFVSSEETVTKTWRPLPVTLVINGVRDPGNMGCLLRTAVSFGLASVLVSKGSVDIWNEKVVRSAMSAHFRLPIYNDLDWSTISRHLHANSVHACHPDVDHMKVYAADVCMDNTDRLVSDLSQKVAMNQSCSESEDSLESDRIEFNEIRNPAEAIRDAFQSFSVSPQPTAYRLPLPVNSHFDVDYFHSNSHDRNPHRAALVVGSEATGLSAEAYYLAHLTGGQRVVISSAPDTESLNVSCATAIILGEMQRQYFKSFLSPLCESKYN